MEPEGSLTHSHVPPTCPYPEPAPSSPYTHIQFPEDPSQYYHPIYAWVTQVVSFPQVSTPEPCIRISSHPNTLHDPPIPLFSILSPKRYWVITTALAVKKEIGENDNRSNELYLLRYLLNYLLTYLITYLIIFLLIYLLITYLLFTYVITYVLTCLCTHLRTYLLTYLLIYILT